VTADYDDFKWALTKALRAAYEDSNDREIGRLRNALAYACDLLDIDFDAYEADAVEWAKDVEQRTYDD
jgi:hypothetical protein